MTTESGYYLQMKDDFGHTYSSPIFNIACEQSSPFFFRLPTRDRDANGQHFSDHAIPLFFFSFGVATPQKKNKPAAHQPDVAQPRPDQAPMSSTGTTKSKGATDSDPPAAAAAAAPAPADPNGVLSPPPSGTATSPVSPPNSAATSTPGSGNGSGPPQVVTAAAAHNAPPAAAIAVPLSLTGAIILLAGGLALHHRKKLAAEKERACQWSSSSSSWPWNNNKDGRSPGLAAAAEALFARAALFRGGAADRTHDDGGNDVYHQHHQQHHRFPEKSADSLYPSSSCYAPSSSYACCAPEPRQRTRELDLPTREFTTRPRPRPRPRAHPPPSPSSYRALWDRRYTLRRSYRSSNNDIDSESNVGGAGGSLWRSLSFAARQKKVLPAPPVATATTPSASALNSPTMTVLTTSVTSEVLPSYLPSPQFDDQGQGDFGFESVPLSPPLPLPPPLHTRGEAADPEDSRMKELRGVYEAVARALGGAHGV